MKQKTFRKSLLFTLSTLTALLLLSLGVHASPYASGVTGTNAAGDVGFYMNEGGATVTVTFEDLTTTSLGVLAKGSNYFHLAPHTSYKISCFKAGTGIPSLISSDADTYSIWDTPRGVAVNKNPKIGVNFGQICADNSALSGKGNGLYLLNADQSYVKGPIGGSFYLGNGSSPYRIRANDDGSFLVSDFSTANASLMQFSPDLSSSNLVLSIVGQTVAAAAGIHGDLFGCGIMKGSLAAGNLVLYTFDSGMGVPADTNCIKGPLTSPGSYNCVFRYNIGAGPIPVSGWNKRPDYAYTYGLDGIAELRTEGDVGNDGKVYCGFGRANASNPNLQILRPPPTTNGIYGDPINGAIQNAAKDPTNWLYTGGASYLGAPFNTPPNGGAAGDPWAGHNGSGVNGGTYCGVRISPDGKYIASVDINNGVTIASLTNGIPNDGTIYGFSQGTFGSTSGMNTGNSRGMDWDAAGNLWICSSGQGLLRCWSLGLTTTAVTGNDWTGTNGTFQLVVPPAQASVTVIKPIASQNYVNNTSNAGTPIPGRFRITLSTADTTAIGPTFVGFVSSGTAAHGVNYLFNTNELPNGVTVFTNGVLFPAGVFAGSNGPNWNVDVKVIPTATPVSGPTLQYDVRVISGTNYSAAAPFNGSIAILNTGPQLLQLSAASPTTLGGMNRGIPNDQARFLVTRLGDTNGPNNDAVNPIVARTLTINNIRLLPPASGASFQAVYGVDYTAGPQNFTGAAPINSSPGIIIAPGVTAVTAMIGNPVKHTNPNLTRTNLQVIINLTNTVAIGTGPSTTNVLSQEGYPYSVTTTSLVLNEYDNANGGEVVLWSNPLTDATDSTNWTMVNASINLGGSPTMPTVISNYDNSLSSYAGQFSAYFGKPVANEAGDSGVTVPQSATMQANGWTTALRVSVNKSPGQAGESGVNLYPQIPGAPWNNGANHRVFQGNYALRFDMFLSLYDFGIGYPTIGTPAREFAAFGINHYGTNANWRLDINPRADGTGARPINADGEWCTIGAASGSITPADYDMFISPPWILPIYDQNGINTNQQVIPFTTGVFIGTNTAIVSGGNMVQVPYTNAYQSSPGFYTGQTNVFHNGGVPNDQQSANNNGISGSPPIIGNSPQNGIIKNPPFSGINNYGGAPDNAWVDVSLELSRQTNLTLLVAQQPIFSASILLPIFGVQNPIAPYTGTPMLGYLDPNRDISDYSAFVYFSNMRVVELSPFIPWTNQPVCLIVTQGQSFTLSSGATFASNPLTNIWYLASTNGPSVAGVLDNGTPKAALATNEFNATSGMASLPVNNIQSGTNYLATWSDQAGSVTSLVSVVEVLAGPGDQTALVGSTASFTVVPTGNGPPTSYHWQTNGVNLVNGAHYAGVTTATLSVSNVQSADVGVYSCLVSNAYTSGVAAGALNVFYGYAPYEFTSVTNSSTSVGLSFMSANPSDTISSYTLQSAGVVTGPYTNNFTGVFVGAYPNFLVTVPKTDAMLFYRLKHN